MKPRKGDSFYIIDRDDKKTRKKLKLSTRYNFWYCDGFYKSFERHELEPNPDKSSRVRWILYK